MEPLPLMGRDFLMILRSNLKLRSIPVVVFAGSEDFLDMQRCRELHVEDYVVKPQRFEELVGMIGSLDHLLAGSSTGAPALG
jgi:CheY-like chemotaxis protein